MLAPGDLVPDFALPVAHADGKKETVQFKALLGKGPIVIEFFPLAFTRVCTTQMCDARDNVGSFTHARAQVFGFSCDTVFTNAQFAKSLDSPHGFFSDANRDVVHKLWATQEVAGVREAAKRGWMVIDQHGMVVDIYVTDKPGDAWVGTKGIESALMCAK
ncbi:MAG: redoxin domain-containing protein [Candidatus Thermoplasmatota archaeon]